MGVGLPSGTLDVPIGLLVMKVRTVYSIWSLAHFIRNRISESRAVLLGSYQSWVLILFLAIDEIFVAIGRTR